MILVDTSVWVDHFQRENAVLVGLLEQNLVLMHPFVLGELLLGGLPTSSSTWQALNSLPAAIKSEDDEVLDLIARERLHRVGIGFVDAHLLAAAALSSALLLTRDKKLDSAARKLQLSVH